MSSASAPRVRFCPAPSGWLHVGSVRAALYNYLHARHHGGVFVFRIEDTDASRATEESMRSMMEALSWIGLDWDEGPCFEADGELGVRGEHGPYRQSERGALYAAVARRLEAAGATYPDFRSAQELEEWRHAHRGGAGQGPPVVKAANFEHTAEQVKDHRAAGDSPSLRLRTPETGSVVIDDLIRGEVRFEWAQISDPVIRRSDGSATYPLANSVDDVAQGISVICRGEDLLSVTPRQVLLHSLLTGPDPDRPEVSLIDAALDEVGFPPRQPHWQAPEAFAHLPMVVGMDRKKLSKRHGSVSIQEFRRQGFLPETLRNYLALLGWAPRDGRERLTDAELVALFDLGDVGRSAAAFDVDKLTAFNGERIRDLPADDLARRLLPYLDGTEGGDTFVGQPPSADELEVVTGLVPLIQERMQRLDEVQRYAGAFLREEVAYDPASVTKVATKAGALAAVQAAARDLAQVDWDLDAIEGALRSLPEELGMGFGKIAQPIRVAITGSTVSPPLFESIALLGRERALARLADAVEVFEAAAAEPAD